MPCKAVGRIVAPVVLAAAGLALSGAAALAQDGDAALEQFTTDNPVLVAELEGHGDFTGLLDPATNRLCYILSIDLAEEITAAHIHQHQNGRPTMPLEAPVEGASAGCFTLDPGFAIALRTNPGGYFVMVHTSEQPGGAARGDLVARTD